MNVDFVNSKPCRCDHVKSYLILTVNINLLKVKVKLDYKYNDIDSHNKLLFLVHYSLLSHDCEYRYLFIMKVSVLVTITMNWNIYKSINEQV